MFRLVTFGGLALLDGAGTAQTIQRRRLAILALLASAGERGLSRDKLLAALWPESPTDNARHTLEQLLYGLRRQIDRGLFLGANPLVLNPAVIETDVGDFVRALEAGDRDTAVGLYRGPFLDGFYLSESPEFETWVEAERARLAQRYAGALEQLATWAGAQNDRVAALEHWRRLVELDPYATGPTLHLMQALADSGNRAAALDRAKVHETLLREEIGTPPNLEITELAERLRAGTDLPGRHATRPASVKDAPRTRALGVSATGSPSRALDPPQVPETVLSPVVPRRRSVLRFTALGAAVLLGVGALFAWRRTYRSSEVPGPTHLAVLPFENLGPPADEYFADGVTDAVRGKLATLPALQVTASNSSSQYKHTTKSPQQVGRELGVQYLLVGKVRWEKGPGGQSWVEVSLELVQVATASTKWQQPFDAALTDVFQVQTDIAGRVAQALDVALGAGERERLAEKPTASLAAYDLYLKGNEALRGFAVDAPMELRPAIVLYERAVALDSSFALAWAQLSRAYSVSYNFGTPTVADAEGARVAAERALALRPDLAEGHLALADYYNFVRKDWARALAEYDAGRKIAPNNADLLRGVGLVARSKGRWDEGLAAVQEALRIDPRSMATARRLTFTLVELRRYPEALAAADRSLALSPHDPASYQSKAMVFLAEGDLPNARAVLDVAQREVEPTTLVAYVANYWDLFWVLDEPQQQLVLRLPPGPFSDDRLIWGLALASTARLRGDTARARAYADSARLAGEAQVRETPDDAQRHVLLGTALAYLGRKAEAIRQGERGVALLPLSQDAQKGAYVQHQLARIYWLVGEPEKALDQLEPLLKVPYILSPGWLRIDPTFAGLKGNPRFERLVAGR